MDLKSKESFYLDLENLKKNRELAKAVRESLRKMQEAKNISQITNLHKLKKNQAFY